MTRLLPKKAAKVPAQARGGVETVGVSVPLQVLRAVGIPERYLHASLRTLPEEMRNECRLYTGSLARKLRSGVGLLLVGHKGELRDVALYAVAKAAIANGCTVRVCSLDALTGMYFSDKQGLWDVLRVDVLAIPEIALPANASNSGMLTTLRTVVTQRRESLKGLLCGSRLPLDGPEDSLRAVCPGIEDELDGIVDVVEVPERRRAED